MINKCKGSGPHTPTQFFWKCPPPGLVPKVIPVKLLLDMVPSFYVMSFTRSVDEKTKGKGKRKGKAW